MTQSVVSQDEEDADHPRDDHEGAQNVEQAAHDLEDAGIDFAQKRHGAFHHTQSGDDAEGIKCEHADVERVDVVHERNTGCDQGSDAHKQASDFEECRSGSLHNIGGYGAHDVVLWSISWVDVTHNFNIENLRYFHKGPVGTVSVMSTPKASVLKLYATYF